MVPVAQMSLSRVPQRLRTEPLRFLTAICGPTGRTLTAMLPHLPRSCRPRRPQAGKGRQRAGRRRQNDRTFGRADEVDEVIFHRLAAGADHPDAGRAGAPDRIQIGEHSITQVLAGPDLAVVAQDGASVANRPQITGACAPDAVEILAGPLGTCVQEVPS